MLTALITWSLRNRFVVLVAALGFVFLGWVSLGRLNIDAFPDTTPALRTVPGTAEINSWGGFQKQYQVRIDPERLLKYDVTFPQVVQALRDNNLNVGGGSLGRAGEMLLINGVGRTSTVAQIRDVPVTARKGVPVRVADVAEVGTGPALRMGGVTAQG